MLPKRSGEYALVDVVRDQPVLDQAFELEYAGIDGCTVQAW